MQNTKSDAHETAPRILIVDDDLNLLESISRGLSLEGFEVLTAQTGDQAKEIIKRIDAPDILLTDAMMPGETQGPDLVDFSKRTWPDMPTVLMSAYAGTGDLTIDVVKGADLIIAKPFGLGELKRQLLEMVKATDRL